MPREPKTRPKVDACEKEEEKVQNVEGTLEEIMTKVAMVDLYHIIGMAELTPPQMMKFTYAIQKYLQYRPTIKAIAKHLDSIFELPKIPVETQYKLMGLDTLTSIKESKFTERKKQ